MNLDRIQAIYNEISKYEIKLADDPRSLGPLYLQNTIAECRNFLNMVSRITLEVHREKQDLARALRANEVAFDVAFNDLISNDDRCRRMPSIDDRKSMANTILREQLATIQTYKGQLQDLEFVDKAIRHRHKELTSTMTEIKLQRSLIRDEMDSGAMYGDERKGDHERGGGPAVSIDDDELDRLLNPEPEPEVAAVESTTEPEATEPTEKLPDEAAVKAFLDAGSPPPPPAEDDFAEIFARL